MATIMHTYDFSQEQLQEFANQVKDIIFNNLVHDNLIVPDKESLLDHYAVILKNKGSLGRFFEKLYPTIRENGVDIVVIKG